ncbi:hypothetical protein IC619_016375 [Hazenella sp. IB182353]|uniref:hypothetical protein n=1 Tax=Polycladospora coralii TaxID=2771432 RepID=UPI001747B2C9|nr:hypothetical protein [Polycladospora coralii]MBS7532023.1 hypothetical protein [Polycladospora coralii]
MSIDSGIYISVVSDSDEKFTKNFLMNLYNYGWSFDDHGQVSYLPIGDIDDYNWVSQTITLANLLKTVEKKEERNEVVGVNITWKDTQIGGDLLINPDGKISFSLTVNRKLFDEEFGLVDVNWYLMRLIPPLANCDLYIDTISYEELR